VGKRLVQKNYAIWGIIFASSRHAHCKKTSLGEIELKKATTLE
jgi:hypothetical protein